MMSDEALHHAMQLLNDGQLEQAKTCLNRQLEINPNDAQALHLFGIITYQIGNIALAIQFIERAIKSNSQVALFHSNLGEMHRQLNAIHLSIQCGERAVALDPYSATALSNLGLAYYDNQNHEQAERLHQQALAINPQFSCSLNNLGSIYKTYGQTKKAMAFYQAAIAAAPHFVDPLNNLGALLLQEQEFSQAFEYLHKAIALAPRFAAAQCNLGLSLLGLNQENNALVHFEKALQLNPGDARAYYGIAKVHLHHHHFDASEGAIQKAIDIQPNEVEFYQFLATIYREQGLYEQALSVLEKTLSLGSADLNSYLNKGSVLMEMGEIRQAEEAFLNVTHAPNVNTRLLAHYSLVQLKKVTANHPSLNALLSIVQQAQDVTASKLEYAYFALGKCYDDIGEWTKAFDYFSLGCHLKRKRITYHETEQLQFTQKLIHCFNQQSIDHLRAFANPSALPIFIVGMPRCGSTLVEQILSSHPEVHGAGEIKYFNHLIQHRVNSQQIPVYYPENILHFSSEEYQTIITQYLTYLRRFSQDAARITDKMLYNFITIGVIHALLPNAKIIHIQRDPIDTCLSCYMKLFTEGQLYSYDLTELGHYYRCYERIMNHWRTLLPANAWLDVRYEALVNNLNDEAQHLIDYCGLSWDPACLDFHQSKRQVRTASFVQVRQPVYTASIERWRRYEEKLAPLMQVLAPTG